MKQPTQKEIDDIIKAYQEATGCKKIPAMIMKSWFDKQEQESGGE